MPFRKISVAFRNRIGFFGTALFLAGLINGIGAGQSPMPSPPAKADGAQAPAKPPVASDKIKRWFEFDQLSTATRYHFIENANRRKAANNVQYQFIAKGRFKFDRKARYSVVMNVATGPGFTSYWNATGIGTGSYAKDLNLRQLYFDAKPDKVWEVQVGGLYVNYGETTEAISYDTDNYITGERVQYRNPKKVYFDEISATSAALLDLNRPDVFHRLRHFGTQNYHQFLVRKQVNKHVGFSADYTFESGIDTLHEAVKFKLPKGQVLDTVLFENYERIDPSPNYGFNIFGEKKLNKTFTVGGGFADIHIFSLNGDRFPPGKRFYFNGLMRLTRELSMTLQYTQGVGPIVRTLPRTRVDVALIFNILEALRRTRYF